MAPLKGEIVTFIRPVGAFFTAKDSPSSQTPYNSLSFPLRIGEHVGSSLSFSSYSLLNGIELIYPFRVIFHPLNENRFDSNFGPC